MLNPLKTATRSLRRSPGFIAAAVVTLGTGIGATTAMFSVVNAVLIRPLPYAHADRLVAVTLAFPGNGIPRAPQGLGTYFTFRSLTRSLDDIGLYDATSANVAEPSGTAEPQRLQASSMTAGLVPLLGIRPVLGRSFMEGEDAPGGAAVALISERMWQRRFGGDRNVIGRFLVVNGVTRTIVGVLPSTFQLPNARTELWLPMALDPNAVISGPFAYRSIARLRAGVSPGAAERDLNALLARVPERYPDVAPGMAMAGFLKGAGARVQLTPLREAVVGTSATSLWILAATALLVLAVACTNVASLVVVRSDARRHELAVRAALGASRMRLAALWMGEGIVVAALGGVVGLLLAAAGVRMLVGIGPRDLPRVAEIGVDGAALAFLAIVTVVAVLAYVIIPALRTAELRAESLSGGAGRGATAGRTRHRMRNALVTAQVAIAIVLLGAAGLMERSYRNLSAVRPGFDAAGAVSVWVALPRATYPTQGSIQAFFDRLIERAAALPGVLAAGVSSKLPLETQGMVYSPVWIEGDSALASRLPPPEQLVSVSGGFFAAIGIPLLAGRDFNPLGGGQRPYEAIINTALATRLWRDSSGTRLLGRQFRIAPATGPLYTVIGVVASTRDTSLRAAPVGAVYFPAVVAPDTNYSGTQRTMALVVRTRVGAVAAVAAIREVIYNLDPALPLFDAAPLGDVVQRSNARLTFTLTLVAVAAFIALLLGAVGLYGVVAYIVALRTRELGLRMALGARPGAVRAMVTLQGFRLAIVGSIAGLGALLMLSPLLKALLYGVGAADAGTLGVVIAVILVVAALASYGPARRASRADPLVALRGD